jgi:hypothetical protein
MRLTRLSRSVAALIALFSVLFMQLAVAGYVCPAHQTGQANESMTLSASASVQASSGCKGMDIDQPSLCHAHAQVGSQSLDKPELPQVQSFATIRGSLIERPADAGHRSPAAQSQFPLLTRATAPPLAIRNCCFRI